MMTKLRVPRSRVREIATLLIAMVMTLGVALYNGYPTVFSDTGSYLGLHNLSDRSIFYSLFLAPARLTHTLWSAVLVQSMMVAYLLRLMLREVFAIRSRLEFLAVIALLCVLTSLPWYAGCLMPDIFSSVLVLGIFMLGFCFEPLGRTEQCFVVALTFVAIVVHHSHIPIAIGLLTVCALVRWMRERYAGGTKPYLALPAAVIAVGLGAVAASNYLMFGIATLSPGGSVFELARLVGNGPAVAYLRKSCPTHKYAACAYLDRMPMTQSEFLWSEDGLITKVGFIGERKEAIDIVTGTIEAYPMWVLRDAIADTIEQLLRNRSADGLRSLAGALNPTISLRELYPADLEAYINSRQNRGELTNMRTIWDLDSSVLQFSVFYCVFLGILLMSDRNWLPVELMLTVGCAILINAFVLGALSAPSNRYGSRIMWLVPLIAIASLRSALGLSTWECARPTISS